MSTIEFIDSTSALHHFCQRISNVPWLAIDTEFLREKTYYHKFCLLQIATPELVVCIDPIALTGEMGELFEIINNDNIIKVLHSGRQDIEIFYHLSGKVTSPVYDTQIVAPLLGYQDCCGYAMLVSSLLNISLNKVHTRTDWSLRPLSKDQIQYAADDVIYLVQIYQLMTKKIAELGRESWVESEFKQLTHPGLYNMPDEDAWLKIKGRQKFTGKQQRIIKVVAEWREGVAKKSDLPKSWIIRDDMILELAKFQPTAVKELDNIRNLTDNFIRRYGNRVCAIIKKGINDEAMPLQEKFIKKKKTGNQEAILDILTGIVRLRADENGVTPSSLGGRKDLEALVFNNDGALNSGWRYEMVGKELELVLQGKRQIYIDNAGQLVCDD